MGAGVTTDVDGITVRGRGRLHGVTVDMNRISDTAPTLAALAPFGRLVVAGISSQEQNEVRTGKLLRGSAGVLGFWLFHCLGRPAMVDEALADLFGRVQRGELRVVVGATYPLSAVARAHEDLQARRTTGKLLLDLSQ